MNEQNEVFVRQSTALTIGCLLLALLLVVLDQWSKSWASNALDYGQPVEVFSFFNLTLMHNYGAAFSFLSDAGGWQRWFFTAVSFVVSIVLVVMIYRTPKGQGLLALALTLVLGGAVGNLIDRVLLGYVVDFISVHYESNYFPTFNIADAAISAGAVLLIVDMFLGEKAEGEAN